MWMVWIYFLCPTADLAIVTATVVDTNLSAIPIECSEEIAPGDVKFVFDVINLPSGRRAIIGFIELLDGREGWSAGIMPALS